MPLATAPADRFATHASDGVVEVVRNMTAPENLPSSRPERQWLLLLQLLLLMVVPVLLIRWLVC